MKQPYLSKTYIVNLLALVVVVATALADPSLMSPKVATIATTVLAVTNILLRTFTNTAIDWSSILPNPIEDE
jgi:hypothetical protein